VETLSLRPGPKFFGPLLAAALSCLAILFALLDIHVFHPGVAWPDEWSHVQLLQEWREGLPLQLCFAKGSWMRAAVAASAWIFRGGLGAMHVPVLLAFAAENALLYLLGAEYFGGSAALAAVAANALSSFTLLRLRSLLSYSVLPFELLLLIFLLPRARRGMAPWAWGLAAGLMLLDYEAWVLGLPVLALALAALPKEKRPGLLALGCGLALGLALVVWLSFHDLAAHLAVRRSQSAPEAASGLFSFALQGLRGYWWGGPALAYTGIRQHPAFEFWAWPLLALGIFYLPRSQRWLLAWAALGFLPLLARNSGAEPQRALLAWPALCLLAGAGAQRLAAYAWRPRAWALVAVLAGIGIVDEAWAYEASMKSSYAQVYGPSLNVAEAGRLALAQGKPFRILTELDNESSAALRYMLPASPPPSSGQEPLHLALIPKAYCLRRNGLGGSWLSLPEQGPCLLLADAPTWARLEKIDAELGELWPSLPRFDFPTRRRICLNYVLAHPHADVWVHTACLEQIFGSSFLMGEVPLDLLKRVEHENLASPSLFEWCAAKLQALDPAWSARLIQHAASLGPGLKQP
jgi:hypothetical protein